METDAQELEGCLSNLFKEVDILTKILEKYNEQLQRMGFKGEDSLDNLSISDKVLLVQSLINISRGIHALPK